MAATPGWLSSGQGRFIGSRDVSSVGEWCFILALRHSVSPITLPCSSKALTLHRTTASPTLTLNHNGARYLSTLPSTIAEITGCARMSCTSSRQLRAGSALARDHTGQTKFPASLHECGSNLRSSSLRSSFPNSARAHELEAIKVMSTAGSNT